MSNQSKKIINMNDPEKQKKAQQKADEQYMMGKPNRMEVANYVNALLEEHYIPSILERENSFRLGLMVVQSILIKKGICTGDEIKEITEEFLENMKKEQEKAQKEAEEKQPQDSEEDKKEEPTE